MSGLFAHWLPPLFAMKVIKHCETLVKMKDREKEENLRTSSLLQF